MRALTRFAIALGMATGLLVGGEVVASTSAQAAPVCSSKSTPVSQSQSAGRRPVVFVHGWTASGTYFEPLGSALVGKLANAVQPFYFDYGADSATWAGSSVVSGCLAQYIDDVSAAYSAVGGDGKVLLVAHSMGGLAILYAATNDSKAAAAIGGVVSLDTPYEGSPFGGTNAAATVESLSESQKNIALPPSGSDAQTCLGVHSDGSPLPAGCKYGLPSYLPASSPLTQIGGSVTVQRTLLGVHLYDIGLNSDGIVPLPSSQGYIPALDASKLPKAEPISDEPVTCSLTSDSIETAIGGDSAVAAQFFADGNALDGLTSGQLTPGLAIYLGAAAKLAPCSHINIASDPAAIEQTAEALQADLQRLANPARESVSTGKPVFSTVATIGSVTNNSIAEWLSGPVAIVEDSQGAYSTYTPTGTPLSIGVRLPDVQADCGLISVNQGGADAVYAISATTAPAQGTVPPLTTATLTKYSADLEPIWSTTIYEQSPSDTGGATCSGRISDTATIAPTADGKVITTNFGNAHGYVIDATHAFHSEGGWTYPLADRVGVDYGWNICGSCGSFPAPVVIDPATGATTKFTQPDDSSGWGIVENATPWNATSYLNSHAQIVLADDVSTTTTTHIEIFAFDPQALTTSSLGTINNDQGRSADRSDEWVDRDTDTLFLCQGDISCWVQAYGLSQHKVLWSQNLSVVCSAGHGAIIVNTNNQLAELSATTGKQLAYTAAASQCPKVVDIADGGSYGWVVGDTGTQVITLAP